MINKTNDIKFVIIQVLLTLCIAFIPIYFYIDTSLSKEAKNIQTYLKEISFDNCEYILNQDKEKISKNKYIEKDSFESFFVTCSYNYDISNFEINLDNCTKNILAKDKESLS